MQISRARKAAYINLLRIERDGAYSSEVLARIPGNLEVKDRRLSHKLTLGVLRKQILLDRVIRLYSSKAIRNLDVEIVTILRLGIFQLCFLDRVPDYSAINEAVELAKFARKKSASGFVNAVLRKASKWEGGFAGLSEMERISVETSHPQWLVDRWTAEFGIDRTRSLCESNNLEPRAAFRFTGAFDGLDEAEKDRISKLIANDTNIVESNIVDHGYIAEKIGSALRSLADEGFVYFQDEASQLAASIAGKLSNGSLLDVCAAPGSKATLISRELPGTALVVAGEYHFHRAKLLKQNALRQKACVQVVCLDGRQTLPFVKGSFGTVLVDAPCTGTGTIRRNPEIRYRASEASLKDLHDKQLEILTAASKQLNSNGVLIYSTCSLERFENEDIVACFLGNDSEFEMLDHRIHWFSGSETGVLRTFPDLHGTDGFFIACLRKR